jgi:hypothetical protein
MTEAGAFGEKPVASVVLGGDGLDHDHVWQDPRLLDVCYNNPNLDYRACLLEGCSRMEVRWGRGWGVLSPNPWVVSYDWARTIGATAGGGRGLKVYVEPRDVWIGYYRGDRHHYVCPLPCIVIRWNRGQQ